MMENGRKTRLEKILNEKFSPMVLSVTDDSHKHAGHHGHDGSPGTHFTVKMAAESFEGQSRVERQQSVYACLEEEFDAGLHALVLRLYTPKDYKSIEK